MRAILALLISLSSGCGAALVLHREVPRPAEIPARAFPIVYVAAADPTSQPAADAIANHLSAGATRVIRVGSDTLLDDASEERVPTLALLVTVRAHEETRTEMSMPTVRCDPSTPCYGYAERFPIDVRVQVADLVLQAFDPHTRAELGHASLHSEDVDTSPIAAQLRVLAQVQAEVVSLIDLGTDTIDLELDGCSDPIARRALELAGRGDIHEARVALETRASEQTVDASAMGALVFDLGQLLRVDVDTSAQDPLAEESARFAAAEAQLLRAVVLEPSERHERALQQLEAERAARQRVRDQAAATDSNFGSAPR